MPAAAVIPALIAYTKVVAVKKLVVGFRNWAVTSRPSRSVLVRPFSPMGCSPLPLTGRRQISGCRTKPYTSRACTAYIRGVPIRLL